MDVFQEKCIRPMRFHRTLAPFNSHDWIYELKLAGIRCIAYLGNADTDLRNPQNVPLLPVFPELKHLHLQTKHPCILDGLLYVLINGSSNQEELIQRFHSSETTGKITSPVSYVAFDLLYYKDHLTTNLPLMQRKALLDATIQETVDLTVSRTIEDRGTDLFQLALRENLDGVVAKRKDSLYQMNTLTNDWVQFLTVPAGYYILCGYTSVMDGSGSLLLGQYHGDTLVYKGSVSSSTVSSGFALKDFLRQSSIILSPCSPFSIAPVFPSQQRIQWFQPTVVCKVELPNSTKKSLHHARFLNIAKSIPAKDCCTEQILLQ